MSWLRRLLGSDRSAPTPTAPAEPSANDAESSPPDQVVIERHGGRIVSVSSIGFIGQFAMSPNKRFGLLWQDRISINGALRDGRYILLDDRRVVLDRRMARPQDGRVADNGTFILNDWGASDTLAGTFHAFAHDGRAIIARAFSANLLNNGLASNGSVAVSQTCNAPGSPDNSVLCVFDLTQGLEIGCWRPESGWASDYAFPGGDRVRMIRREGIPLDYRFDGEFLDRHAWYADEVERGTYFVIKDALAAGETVTGVGLDALRRGAKVAVANPDERWKAQSLRLLGEIEEKAGNEEAALANFERALALNPSIGVAKRSAVLARRLGR